MVRRPLRSHELALSTLAFLKLDQFCACDVSPRPSLLPSRTSRVCTMLMSIMISRCDCSGGSIEANQTHRRDAAGAETFVLLLAPPTPMHQMREAFNNSVSI